MKDELAKELDELRSILTGEVMALRAAVVFALKPMAAASRNDEAFRAKALAGCLKTMADIAVIPAERRPQIEEIAKDSLNQILELALR